MNLIPTDIEFERLSASEDAAYMLKKITGGGSGRTGAVFEARFIAFCILEEAIDAKTYETPLADVRLGVQVRSYIDDFIVARKRTVNWYEIKSGETITWESGERRTIAENFVSQMVLDLGRGLDASYHLVVPTRRVETDLEASRSYKVRDVKINMLPNTDDIDDIETEYSWFPRDLWRLIPLHAPRRDFKDLYVGLQGVVLNLPNNVLRDLEHIAKALHDRYEGAFTCIHDASLQPRTREVLERVPGVKVAVCGDQLHFRCTKPTVRGKVDGCRIGELSGNSFEQEIQLRIPTTWDALAPILWRDYGGH